MQTSVARCNECVVYHNWHRKGDWKKRFVKIVTGDFVDVPRKFLENNIRGQIPDEVNLDLPNGKTYTVQVSKQENGLIFQSGWAEFARTYELVQGDILLFESSGSSCFEVRIFNQTGCEKELSCVAMKNTACLDEKSMPHDNDMQSPNNERCGNMSGKRHAICKVCAAFYYWHHMDKMRFFMVMMGVSASKNELTIPKEFSNNVRGKISDEIKLEVPDVQAYRVQVDKEPNEVVLRSGWDAFVSAYELKEGDTLLFVYTGNSHLKVQIFNLSGCDKLLSCVVKNNHMHSPRESMKKLCTVCLECVDRHYWHMKDHDWCFLKVMSLSNFKDEMAIPDEFTTNFRGHISDKVKLEVPDGNIYNVQVAKEQDKFILRSGWVDFTGAYELKQYDSLFFIYSGDSHFKVRILKPSGCEKALSYVTMSCGPNVQERVICHALSLPSIKRCRNDNLTDNLKTAKVTPTDSPSQKSSSEMNTQDVTSSKDIPEPRSSYGLPGSTES
uniref:TF-B3 domain-containing protein n=1 Tax=Triticum urartu TaxID=4572 RepID=A0A8R7Q8X8_TRIUA